MRLMAYGVLGCFCELAWTAILAGVRYHDPSLKGRVSIWMFPVYALGLGAGLGWLSPLIAHWPWGVRGLLYALGVWAVEVVVGLPTRRRLWDYSDAKWNWRGVIRWDYAPVWAALGLAVERVRPFIDRAFA
jgi:hypothetical protein